MSLTPEDIQGKRFHDAFRGYSHEEVDVFLDEVSASFASLYQQVEAARARIAELEGRVEDVGVTEGMLKRTLLAAQRAADDAVTEAKSEAARTTNEAQSEAARTVSEANSEAARTIDRGQAQAAQLIQEATKRAEELIADSHARQTQLEQQASGLRRIDAEHRATLRAHLESQLRALDELPLLPELPPGPGAYSPSAGAWPPGPVRRPSSAGTGMTPTAAWPSPPPVGGEVHHPAVADESGGATAEGPDYEIIPQGSLPPARPASSFPASRRPARTSAWGRDLDPSGAGGPPGGTSSALPHEDDSTLEGAGSAGEPHASSPREGVGSADDGEEKSVRELFWGKS